MHQPLSDESLLLPTTNLLLNPTLKRALGVMDAQLEDELTRYRRYRRGLKVAPSAVQVVQRGDRPKSQAKAPMLPLAAMPKATTKQLNVPKTVVANSGNPDTATPLNTAIQHPATPPLPPLTPVSIQHNPEEVLSLALTQQEEPLTEPSASVEPENLPSSHKLSAYGLYAAADEGLADDFVTDRAPTDYMESSEELLRSLAAEEASAAAERHVLEGLLTPFGVGAMMLMLLGSGMFGYLIMNPASLTALQQLAGRIASFRSRPTHLASSSSSHILSSGSPTDMGWLSNAPALDSDEFLSLSLNNFSALRTRPGGDGLMSSPLSLVTKNGPGKQGQPRLLPNQKGNQKPGGIGNVLKNLTPLTIQPLTPPAPTIGGDNGGFAAPIRVAKSYEGGGGSYNPPAPQIQAPAPTYYEPPRRPARSYQPEPSYSAPARRYEPPAEKPYSPPVVPVVELPPAPVVVETPAVQPQGDFRVVTPYTNDADLEAAQKSDPTASFRNLDDGAYIQRGGSYSSREAADAAAAKLKEQGVEAEVK